MKTVFSQTRRVKESEIDTLNHVNNVVYVQWMEEVANLHWKTLTKEQALDEYVWVVVKHEINYLKQALLGDEITVKTWVGKSHGFQSERFIEFYKNEVLLVQSKTMWGMLDASSFKPVRITEKVLNILEA